MKIESSPRWRKMVGQRLEMSIAAMGNKPAEIARLLGITQQRLSNYITGSRPLDIAIAIQLCQRFGLTLDWLYIGDMAGLRFDLAQRMKPTGGEGDPAPLVRGEPVRS